MLKSKLTHPCSLVSDFESVNGDVNNDSLLVLSRSFDSHFQLLKCILTHLKIIINVNGYPPFNMAICLPDRLLLQKPQALL